MYCQRHRSVNYRFISVMFWAFPYLLWQAFGHISGFFVGVVLAVMLTAMFNNLFRRSNGNSASFSQQSLQASEEQPHFQEEVYRPYQSGYQGEMEPYYGEQTPLPTAQFQPQYEEMQVPYPQEMPPIEQRQE
jgi:hypothetical protein